MDLDLLYTYLHNILDPDSDLDLLYTYLHNILDPDSNPVGTSVAFMGKSHGANVYDHGEQNPDLISNKVNYTR